ncbi:hypothetical protein [Microbacterium sp. ZXX196]|uniref:hypothetical protein n=1 Tax=Microbacterium sp. ZXX196 TaxID=2609291 RepID=UPI0012B82867|nr:hypothetical protein [Microbacterium sp. ZXX196]MTE24843.1 hypothetical protein [Microbacterium sp. ZXX196]
MDELTADGHGEFGYLTTAQWRSFQWAVSYSLVLVPFLRDAGNYSISVDEGRTAKTEPALGMPATQIAAIEIESLAGELRHWPDLEDIANDTTGWQVAIDFTREVQTAAHRWPMEDKPHDVEDVRCTHCGMIALVYQPPQVPGDETVVRCAECGQVEDDRDFAERLAIMRDEMKRLRHAS